MVLQVLLCYLMLRLFAGSSLNQRLALSSLNARLNLRVVNIYPGVGYFVPLLENSIARSLVVNNFGESACALGYVCDVFFKAIIGITVYCDLFVYNIVVNFFEVVRYPADYIDKVNACRQCRRIPSVNLCLIW